MHFLLGLLFGYYIRGKASLLAATLVVIALLCFIVLPAIALSGLALLSSSRIREELMVQFFPF